MRQIRLRRRARLRRDLDDLDELASQSSDEADAKRGRPSAGSGSDTASESSSDPLEYEHHHVTPTRQQGIESTSSMRDARDARTPRGPNERYGTPAADPSSRVVDRRSFTEVHSPSHAPSPV